MVETGEASPGGTAPSSKAVSVLGQFQSELSNLVDGTLHPKKTISHFIRCIKPNNVQPTTPAAKASQRDTFDDSMVMSQLRSGGALGAVQVMRKGFPNRMEFSDFVLGEKVGDLR